MIWLLAACLEPFEHDAHDLVDLRIVGMSYESGKATAFAWEGENAWSAVVPTQSWTGDVNGYHCNDTVVDTGAAADCGPRPTQEVTVTISSGAASETGTLVYDADGEIPKIGAVVREQVDGGWSLSLSAPASHVTHWMAPRGEIEETGQHEALYVPPGDGIWPVVALTLDGKGGNAWTIVDVPEGDIGPALWTERRVIPVDEIPEGLDADRWFGVIEPVDDLLGYRLVGLSGDYTQADVGFCGFDSGGWDPDSLVTRECGRDEVTVASLGLWVEARAVP